MLIDPGAMEAAWAAWAAYSANWENPNEVSGSPQGLALEHDGLVGGEPAAGTGASCIGRRLP
jgi:hypothetical protein